MQVKSRVDHEMLSGEAVPAVVVFRDGTPQTTWWLDTTSWEAMWYGIKRCLAHHGYSVLRIRIGAAVLSFEYDEGD